MPRGIVLVPAAQAGGLMNLLRRVQLSGGGAVPTVNGYTYRQVRLNKGGTNYGDAEGRPYDVLDFATYGTDNRFEKMILIDAAGVPQDLPGDGPPPVENNLDLSNPAMSGFTYFYGVM